MDLYYIKAAMPWGEFSVVYSGDTIVMSDLSGAIPSTARKGRWPELEDKLARYAQGLPVTFTEAVWWEDYPPFTRAVLQYIYSELPWGTVCTYGDVARALGKADAARAVGQALARNKVPLIVPCHRVIAAHGLGGFSAAPGLSLKRAMLTLESCEVV